ncbi:MAG: DUF4139 domain-containing protein [Bacteroidetes bacterium]|nr:DUF4139 domain-containing protein [Bacteroidota bacterium]
MKVSILLVALLATTAATAQTIEKNISSKVTRVTVFPQGAQVTRTTQASIGAGRSELTFTGISPYMDQSSLRVEASGGFTILSVSPVANKMHDQEKRKDIEALETSRKVWEKQQTRDRATLSIYTEEEKLLEANYKVGGDNTGLKAADLAAVLDLHRTRLRDLKFNEIDYNERIQKEQDSINRINQQISALNANTETSTMDVVVTIQSEAGATGDFTLSYVVNNAGWNPSYDLYVDDINKPLTLKYKANVWQNTGEQWKDVRIAFSNGNPNESGIAPVLNPLWLRNLIVAYPAAPAARFNEVVVSSYKKALKDDANYLSAQGNVNYTPQTQNATSISFELATPYTVVNDGQIRAVDMKSQEIPASFEYFCVPKHEKKAFLMAHIPNWLDYNLMDGEVNLYYEGTYTGKTAFSLANTDDTLNLSLGVDKGITVERKQVKDYNKRVILSDKKTAAASFEISVRNNKKFPINITIEDQVPVTTDKDISIDDISHDGATRDNETGKVTWKLTIPAGKEQKERLSYTVKYPKSYRVQID